MIGKTLLSEIQLEDDQIREKLVYDREIHQESKDRLLTFIRTHEAELRSLSGQQQLDFGKVDADMFDWAWMNIGTRCFGTYHLPHELAMEPLLDLMNHSMNDDKLGYFLYPISFNIKMLERNDTTKINKELELDYQAEMADF